MGFFDRFKPKKERELGPKKQKHVVAGKEKKAKDDEAKHKQFAAVPAAGMTKKEAAAKTAGKPSAKTAKPRREDTGDAYRILRRAVVSEKATALAATRQYVFEVAARANKHDISRAIQSTFGVRPSGVNVVTVVGKDVRFGRTTGRTKQWKKAIVTLPPGQSLEAGA